MFFLVSLTLSVSLFVSLLFWTDLHPYESFSIAYFLFILIHLIDRIGKKIVIKEFIVAMATLTILVMPVLFYHKFNETNDIAVLWDNYMRESVDSYYTYTLPAILALSFGLFIKNPFIRITNLDYQAILKLKTYNIITIQHVSFLFVLGLIGTFVIDFVPGSLRFVFYLLQYTLYVSGLYAYYSTIKFRKLFFYSTIILLFYNAIRQAMFGEFIYFVALCGIVLLIGNKSTFLRKSVIILLGLYLIVILQTIKFTYRQSYWEGQARTTYFFELFYNNLFNFKLLEDDLSIFQLGSRFNQGILVSETLDKVPSMYPFAHGETIFESLRAIFLPRFLDENKRKAGGAANLERFLGIKNLKYSMNIGPLGEGYGNFGRLGGIIYMFFYGLTFNVLIYALLKTTKSSLTIVLWFPFIFFYSMHVETDMLTTFNSMFKGSIYLFILIKLTRLFWGLRL